MLKRIYIDNFKCFVNFELHLDQLNLFLGTNGSGKTALLHLLHKLQSFIVTGKKVAELFKGTELTRWVSDSSESLLEQHFELDILGNGGLYRYQLQIEHQFNPQFYLHQARVKQEHLSFNGQPLFKAGLEPEKNSHRSIGLAYLYNDDYTCQGGAPYPFDWSSSGLTGLHDRQDNQKLTWFKKYLARFFIIQLEPRAMSSEIQYPQTHPTWLLDNYANWFDHLADEYRGAVHQLEEELRQVIKGFGWFTLTKVGETTKILKVDLAGSSFKLDELSEGQRALIALYTLLYCLPPGECTLCIDEPENFLALPEIQPWLDRLYDRCCSMKEHTIQVLLVSHHPRIINYLSSSAGFWLSRPDQRHVRWQKVTDREENTGLSIAKLIELGWIYDQ